MLGAGWNGLLLIKTCVCPRGVDVKPATISQQPDQHAANGILNIIGGQAQVRIFSGLDLLGARFQPLRADIVAIANAKLSRVGREKRPARLIERKPGKKEG